jgi:hypothetical protein
MLTASPTSINLGSIPFGKPHKFQFTVKNEGCEPIQITKLWVGCSSCTKAEVKKAMLADGECTTVDVTFTPGSIGIQNKNVQVQWNEDKVIKLSFTAESYA